MITVSTHKGVITSRTMLFAVLRTGAAMAMSTVDVPTTSRRLRRALSAMSVLRAMFASPEKSSARRYERPERKYYPPRYVFIEDALMAREMDRL
jgi:hypothetical protein